MWSLPASLHLPGVALQRPRKSPARDLDSDCDRWSQRVDTGRRPLHGATRRHRRGSRRPARVEWRRHRVGVHNPHHRRPRHRRRAAAFADKGAQAHAVAFSARGGWPGRRAGGREWFTDRVFVESKQTHLQAAWTTSAMVHAAIVILVLLLLAAWAARRRPAPRTRIDVSLRMPALASLLPAVAVPPPVAQRPLNGLRRRPTPRARPRRLHRRARSRPPHRSKRRQASRLNPRPRRSPQRRPWPRAGGATDGEASVVAGGTGSGPSVEAAEARRTTARIESVTESPGPGRSTTSSRSIRSPPWRRRPAAAWSSRPRSGPTAKCTTRVCSVRSPCWNRLRSTPCVSGSMNPRASTAWQ